MKIEMSQVENEGKNEFIIEYNDTLQYKAKTPFVSLNEPLNLEKKRNIKIFDAKGNEIYTTEYKYIKNLKESFIPMKFLITGSQKIYQLLFTSDKNTIKVYYEKIGILNSRYVIEINDKHYYCYSIEDGYIRHFPIYYGEIQIGEVLKSNVIVDAKDEYCCYLKEGYESISDGIVALLLYLDRKEYSSSNLAIKSYDLSKKFSYDRTNKYYNKEWVKENFGDEYYKKVDEDAKLVKGKLKQPIKTSKEQWNSIPTKKKGLLLLIILAPWVIILIIFLIISINKN